jgi:hypothetical protein
MAGFCGVSMSNGILIGYSKAKVVGLKSFRNLNIWRFPTEQNYEGVKIGIVVSS